MPMGPHALSGNPGHSSSLARAFYSSPPPSSLKPPLPGSADPEARAHLHYRQLAARRDPLCETKGCFMYFKFLICTQAYKMFRSAVEKSQGPLFRHCRYCVSLCLHIHACVTQYKTHIHRTHTHNRNMHYTLHIHTHTQNYDCTPDT